VKIISKDILQKAILSSSLPNRLVSVSVNWKKGLSEKENIFLEVGHINILKIENILQGYKNVNIPTWKIVLEQNI
jgi:hypothetical protein